MAKYTESVLRAAVEQSLSVAGVLRDLGLVPAGGTHAHVSRLIKRYGIDTSHFTGQGWRQNRTFPYSGPPGEPPAATPGGIASNQRTTATQGTYRDRTSPRLHIVRKQWRMADDPTCAASRSHQRELPRQSTVQSPIPLPELSYPVPNTLRSQQEEGWVSIPSWAASHAPRQSWERADHMMSVERP